MLLIYRLLMSAKRDGAGGTDNYESVEARMHERAADLSAHINACAWLPDGTRALSQPDQHLQQLRLDKGILGSGLRLAKRSACFSAFVIVIRL